MQRVADEHTAQGRLDDLINSAVRDIVSGHQLIEVVRHFVRELPLEDMEDDRMAAPMALGAAGARSEPMAAPHPAAEGLARERLSTLMVERARQGLAD